MRNADSSYARLQSEAAQECLMLNADSSLLACRAKRRKNAREHRPDLSWVGCSLLLTILLPPAPCSLPLKLE